MLGLGCLRTTTVVGTHGLDRFHGERSKMSNVTRKQGSNARTPVTKSPFLSMTNQNITSPALYHQNQPPDSGSVHESQEALGIAASQPPLYMRCVFLFRVFYNFQWRGEAPRPRTSPSLQKFVSADDKSKHKHAQPFITRTNILTLALYMSHIGGSFGYRDIAGTALHAVCVFV